MRQLTSIEVCAGGGGQALGLEQAGFRHSAVVEIDAWAAETLRLNRPEWDVIGPRVGDPKPYEGGPGDIYAFDATPWAGHVDLLAGGVPCPPFSYAGKRLGEKDERDLFPEALRLVAECEPRVVMLENVRGLLASRFEQYRAWLEKRLHRLGYRSYWKLLQASDYGVPQLRPRTLLVAVRTDLIKSFEWPPESSSPPPTVGDVLFDLLSERGWKGASQWREGAQRIAPTLVGGSKKHGGPDLGPTRAKREWDGLGVDAKGVADEAPAPDFEGKPRLTVRMAARLQGFPDAWTFAGRKTASYRQVGNAFPPPVARAVGLAIAAAIARSEMTSGALRAA